MILFKMEYKNIKKQSLTRRVCDPRANSVRDSIAQAHV